MRYLVGFILVLALSIMGCSETSGTGGSGGVGGQGGGGVGGEGGSAGDGGSGGGGVGACQPAQSISAIHARQIGVTTGCRAPLQMLKSRALIGNVAVLPGEGCCN